MAGLVLKSWQASETPDEKGVFVKIVGRAAGFFSWILSIIGVDPTTSMTIYEDKVFFEQGSLAGFRRAVIPIRKISSAFYGYKKPWKEALLLSLVFGALIPVIGALVGIIYYILKKTLMVGIIEVGSVVNVIEFRRSVIEGKKIEEHDGAKIAAIIQDLIDKSYDN